MRSVVLLLAFVAASTAVQISQDHGFSSCALFGNCEKTMIGGLQHGIECPPEDEDCATEYSGSGSGSGSGDPYGLDVCEEGGMLYKMLCRPEPTRESTEPTRKPTEPRRTTTPAAPITTARPTTVRTVTEHPTTPGPVSDVEGTHIAATTPGPVSDVVLPDTTVATLSRHPTRPLSTTPNTDLGPNGKDTNKEEDQDAEDDGDKAWMIGVIIGCVIGSAILGVLAAVVVIKLKYAGGQSGSFQTHPERGSTASSSSQKPLYI